MLHNFIFAREYMMTTEKSTTKKLTRHRAAKTKRPHNGLSIQTGARAGKIVKSTAEEK